MLLGRIYYTIEFIKDPEQNETFKAEVTGLRKYNKVEEVAFHFFLYGVD